jgi:hypothetical protein
MEFSIPLVAPDPYRYAVDTAAGMLGAFTGGSWLESFTLSGGAWVETFTLSGGGWDTFALSPASGPYPVSLTIASDGTVSSRRVVFEVHGPLATRSWYLLHEGTGRRMWVQAPVADGQTLTVDVFAWTATLDGQDVTHLLYGQPLGFDPGVNTYRLVSSVANAVAYATITARAAYE